MQHMKRKVVRPSDSDRQVKSGQFRRKSIEHKNPCQKMTSLSSNSATAFILPRLTPMAGHTFSIAAARADLSMLLALRRLLVRIILAIGSSSQWETFNMTHAFQSSLWIILTEDG
jgi:hypothetical protein